MATQHAISRSDANAEIRRFLEIREEAINANAFANLSQQARSFYESNSISFVFYKDQLDTLIAAVTANAYRIYFAADAYGAPTLVIYPCEISADESTASNKTAPSTPPGGQYPKIFGTSYDKSNFDVGNE